MPAALEGQVLRLSPAPPSSGDLAVVEVSLSSPASEKPTALQWDVTVEGPGVTFIQDVLPSGPKGSSAKALHCGARNNTAGAKTSFCMLVGGLDPIPDGKIVRIRLAGPTAAGRNGVRVRIEKGVAVFRDLRRVELAPVELAVPAARRTQTTESRR